MIKRFLASPFSGYLSIALLLAIAGSAYWFWSQAEELGSLRSAGEAQAQTLANQEYELATMKKIIASKDEALQAEVADKEKLLVVAHTMKGMINDARAKAGKAIRECMDMHVADGMQFGPSNDNADANDKASTVVDG